MQVIKSTSIPNLRANLATLAAPPNTILLPAGSVFIVGDSKDSPTAFKSMYSSIIVSPMTKSLFPMSPFRVFFLSDWL